MFGKEFLKLVEKAAEDVVGFADKKCLDSVASASEVQAYTDATIANAAGFNAFFAAFMKQDLEGVMAAMSDDPIFDAPFPMPNGLCIKGEFLVREAWKATFATGVTFEVEEAFVTGDRGVVRWRWSVPTPEGPKTLRGADIFHMKDGKVAAKLTYTKAPFTLGG